MQRFPELKLTLRLVILFGMLACLYFLVARPGPALASTPACCTACNNACETGLRLCDEGCKGNQGCESNCGLYYLDCTADCSCCGA